MAGTHGYLVGAWAAAG